MTFNDFLYRIEVNKSLRLTEFINAQSKVVDSNNYVSSIQSIAVYLQKELGIFGGKKVVSIIENGIDWNILDFATLITNNLHIPLSPSTSKNEMEALLIKLDAEIVLASPLAIKILGKHNFGGFMLKDFSTISAGFEMFQKPKWKNGITSCVFLTSGTSNQKKAVLHSHEFVLNNIELAAQFYDFRKEDIALSFLPIHYAFERMYNYVYQYSNVKIIYADRKKSLIVNILENRPTIFCIVPSMLDELLRDKGTINSFLEYYHELSPRIICSGAKIPNTTLALLNKHKIEIYEMYGSTETLIVSCSKPGQTMPGTSGQILDLSKVSLDKNNELRIETNQSTYLEGFGDLLRFSKGYYKTGDIGRIKNGFLTIIGRSSNLVKNRFGLFINIAELEIELRQLLLNDNLIGFMHNGYFSCIIENSGSFSEENLIHLLKERNLQKADGDRIGYFALTGLWSLNKELYTISRKLRKNELLKKYRDKLIKL